MFSSCSESRTTTNFENEFIEYKNLGGLIQIVLNEESKLKYLESLICDSLHTLKNSNFVHHVVSNGTDSSWSLHAYKNDGTINCFDSKRFIAIHLNQTDSLTWGGERFSFGNLRSIMDSIAFYQNTSLSELMLERSINGVYRPSIPFKVETNSYSCDDDFLEKLMELNNSIIKVYERTSTEVTGEENEFVVYLEIMKFE